MRYTETLYCQAFQGKIRTSPFWERLYRADIDKVSGWRIHVQYINGQIHLKDIIEGQKHDNVIDVIKSKKVRYE